MSKTARLQKLFNQANKITIAAMDHRGSLKRALHPENPEATTEAEILAWKKKLVSLFEDEVAGILIDPVYGKDILPENKSRGWLLSMEKTGYRGDGEARETEIIPNWSVKQAKEMGACGVKLLLYYDPENSKLSQSQKALAEKIGRDCQAEEMVYLLEPLSYKVEGTRSVEVLKIVEELKDLPVDIFKLEYPDSREACRAITQMLKVPWVLLSAGMEYDKYRDALKIAMEEGATGFAVGRAVWQEFGDFAEGAERDNYFQTVAKTRMKELVEIVNGYSANQLIRQSDNSEGQLTRKSESQIRRVEQAEVLGKRVVVRVDWNVTLGKTLQIVDDTRIVRTLATIKWLLGQGARQVILISHLGKAEEKRSLKPVVEYASSLIGEPIKLVPQFSSFPSFQSEKLLMMENLRLWEGEEANDPTFAQELASLGDIYVNEAFGESHREVASIVGIPRYLPAYAGMWLMDEEETILKVRDNPERPYIVVMGGAKVKDKIKLIEILSHSADTILLGGKLANEYVQQGIKVSGKAKIVTPLEGSDILDIGLETQKLYASEIMKAKTVAWNGPMGMVEDERYRAGTYAIFEAMVENESAYTLVGGGDTLSAIGKEEHLQRIDHVSTGGGAMLKLLEKGSLVGIEALPLT